MVEKYLAMFKEIITVLKIRRIDGPYQNVKGQPVVYLIFNRTELQQVLFPLFLYHKILFLTETRRSQFEKAIYFMESGDTKFTETNSNLQPIRIHSNINKLGDGEKISPATPPNWRRSEARESEDLLLQVSI